MGMDAYAMAAVGFEVSEEDLVRVEKAAIKTCNHGHRQPENQPKFCDQDGTPFGYRETKVPTDAAVALDPDILEMGQYPDWWYSFLDGDTIHRTTDDDTIICGEKVADSGSHQDLGGAYVTALNWSKLQKVRQRVSVLRAKMGMGDRPLHLYSWLYISI